MDINHEHVRRFPPYARIAECDIYATLDGRRGRRSMRSHFDIGSMDGLAGDLDAARGIVGLQAALGESGLERVERRQVGRRVQILVAVRDIAALPGVERVVRG